MDTLISHNLRNILSGSLAHENVRQQPQVHRVCAMLCLSVPLGRTFLTAFPHIGHLLICVAVLVGWMGARYPGNIRTHPHHLAILCGRLTINLKPRRPKVLFSPSRNTGSLAPHLPLFFINILLHRIRRSPNDVSLRYESCITNTRYIKPVLCEQPPSSPHINHGCNILGGKRLITLRSSFQPSNPQLEF